LDDYHKKLLEELPNLGSWHHAIDLGEGYRTVNKEYSAYNPEDRWKLIEPFIPEDLSGKTVLDLGCNSGYLSMKMKKRGAERVVAVEPSLEAIKQAKFLAKWFDVEFEIIQNDAHVYCLTTDERFDYVIFLGLFYHLKYPIIVLDRLAEMTKSRMFFQTVRFGPLKPDYVEKEDYTLEEKNEINNSPDFPKMFFVERKFIHDLSNWWLTNEPAVISLLRSARFKIIDNPGGTIYICEPDNPYGKKVYDKLVFPKYGKEGAEIFPST